MNIRNRMMLELMARGGMRIGEVLNLKSYDIQERNLSIQNPKSGRPGEVVYVPRKLLVRLTSYVKDWSCHLIFTPIRGVFASNLYFIKPLNA
jgi:integrase/recombinase XerD